MRGPGDPGINSVTMGSKKSIVMTIESIDAFRECYCPPARNGRDDLLRILFRPDHSLYFCPGSCDLSDRIDEIPSQGLVLSFSIHYLQQPDHLHLFTFSTTLLLEQHWAADLSGIILLMCREYSAGGSGSKSLLQSYLSILLVYVTRYGHPVSRPMEVRMGPGIVSRFVIAVEQEFRTRRYVSDYAEMLGVTPSYLNEVVKRSMGESAGSHIRRRVALEAKRMAVYADMTMKSVAYALGFADPSYFSRFFRAIMGENFSDYRKTQAAGSLVHTTEKGAL